MAKAGFERDARKDRENLEKHGVSFAQARLASADSMRVLAEDPSRSAAEARHFCFGRVGQAIITVRFTCRNEVIRIFGAGYWRKGKQIYERENKVHERTPRKPQGRR